MDIQIMVEGSEGGGALEESVRRWVGRVQRVVALDACTVAIRIGSHWSGGRVSVALEVATGSTRVGVRHEGRHRCTDDALSLISIAFRDVYHRLAPPEHRSLAARS